MMKYNEMNENWKVNKKEKAKHQTINENQLVRHI